MGTEADRPQVTRLPLPPLAPPRPTGPPRPGRPPAPRTAPEDRPSAPGGKEPAAEPGADPIPQDEPTARVSPRREPRKEPREKPDHEPGSGAEEPEKPEEKPQEKPAARERMETGEQRPAGAPAARTVRRPPFPAVPPQPPPPSGQPVTAGGARPLVPGPAEDLSGPPTFRLRPIRVDEPRRPPLRTVAAVACLVLGVGLLGGTAAGTLFSGDAEGAATATEAAFGEAREMWRTIPVNTLFPRTVQGENAGPGGSDRRWRRVAVAPDSTCRHAFDPLLTKVLSPVGCRRLVRATYADETSTSVTTVGIVFTRADGAGMRGLRERFARENLTARTDLMPRAYAPRGTVAADFGDAQRASWTIRVLTQAPAVVFAVTGFADGRTASDPQPADEATKKGETSTAAQAGLGHDAQGLADRVEKGLRKRLPDAGPEDAS